MKKKARSLIVFALMLTAFSAFSQETSVAIMKKTEVKKNMNTNSALSVKIDPIQFLRGDIPLYFEKNIYNNLAIEAGVGITLKDYILNLSDDIAWDEHSEVGINRNIGYSYRFAIRYYAYDYSFASEGMYFELKYRSQVYSADLQSIGSEKNLDKKLKHTNSDVLLSVGYVKFFEENAFIEPYIGFGIRNRRFDRINLDQTNNASFELVKENETVPLISLGVKLGISF